MTAKKDSTKTTTKKPASTKSKGTKKKSSSGILGKVKDAAGEILTSAAQGAALSAINVAAGAVGELLEDGKKTVKKPASTKSKAVGDAGTKGTGSAGKLPKSKAKPTSSSTKGTKSSSSASTNKSKSTSAKSGGKTTKGK